MSTDKNCLSYWFPPIEAAGLLVPETRIVETDCCLLTMLDGYVEPRFDGFIGALTRAAHEVREGAGAFFLRTGHGSGKHEWKNTCYVPDEIVLARHVGALVEWSELVDICGLPTRVWAVRRLIDTAPIFRCADYGGFPVTREFRVFVRGDVVEHIQPYWPADAVEKGAPDDPDWRAKLAAISMLADNAEIAPMAVRAVDAVGGGYWSVDFLEDRGGDWWLTDMADGDRSFRYDPEFPR